MQKRALLIGNKTYQSSIYQDIPGVSNDLDTMYYKLKAIGFSIQELINASEDELDESLSDFAQYENPSEEDINMIYYSGHGATCDSHLCLITVEDDENDHKNYKIEELVERFEGHPSNLVIVLDMCRSGGIDTLPSERFRNQNVTIIYSTGTGEMASVKDVSTFTQYFCRNLSEIGKSINGIVAKTRQDMENDCIQQTPVLYQSATKEVIIRPLELNIEWFLNQSEASITHLGKRYCPEVNVTINLDRYFNALCFENEFVDNIKGQLHELLANSDRNQRIIERIRLSDPTFDDNRKRLFEQIEKLRILLNELLNNIAVSSQNVPRIIEEVTLICDEQIQACEKLLSYDIPDERENGLSAIYNVKSALSGIRLLLNSDIIGLALKPCAFLHGDGGIGKTHSIAHLVRSRNHQYKPSVLLLGSAFINNDSPYSRIMENLKLNCTFQQFLDYINSFGQENNSRVLLCIDALNEGDGNSVWNYQLQKLIEDVAGYPWIALLISGRTYFLNQLTDNEHIITQCITPIKHPGFSEVGYDSIIRYFEHYNILWKPSLMMLHEFSKPLFLRLFCEAYANRQLNEENVTINNIFSAYINQINARISQICNYNSIIPLLKETIMEIQKKKYSIILETPEDRLFGFVRLSNAAYIEIIQNTKNKYGVTKDFLTALLQEDILTRLPLRDDEESIYITYERLEDYYLAKIIFDEYNREGYLNNKVAKYLLKNEELLREFICRLANEKEIEIDDIYNVTDDIYTIGYAFIDALVWRKPSSISEKTMTFINQWINSDSDLNIELWDNIVSLAPFVDHPLNGEFVFNYLKPLKMAKRDALYIPLWDDLFDRDDTLTHRLIHWMLEDRIQEKIDSQSAICAAKCICWFLISSNSDIRDQATKALQNTMMSHLDIIAKILSFVEQIDDPYVFERVLLASYGCVMLSDQVGEYIREIADWVYKHIFCADTITTNIMVRDYARCIIKYARTHLLNAPEYPNAFKRIKSVFPLIPSDEEIKSYETKLGYKVVHSMRVEYDRQGNPGGYGDFGRYTFQSYFSIWQRVIDYNDLMNIALKNIYLRGYDVKIHGAFDDTCRYSRGGETRHERIGKKYQWIALYELAGYVIDRYTIKPYIDEYYGFIDVFHGLRNYDPSLVLPRYKPQANTCIHDELYSIKGSLKDSSWETGYDDLNLNQIGRFIEFLYKEQKFFLVKGDFDWKSEPEFGRDSSSNPYRRMYMLINMYFVKEKDLQEAIHILSKEDFMGRWMPENGHISKMFVKERYWSDIYAWGRDETWQRARGIITPLKFMVPYISYSSGEMGDKSWDEEINYYFPCEEIVNASEMRSTSLLNSIMINSANEIVSFDSAELLNEPIGLYIKQETVLQYAKRNKLVPVWTVLAEKMTIHPFYDHDHDIGRTPHLSGVYYMEMDNQIKGIYRITE